MRKLLGAMLLAIGALVAGLSGLCTLIFAASDTSLIGVALLLGIVPFLVGGGLVLVGRALLRRAREEEQRAETDPEIFS